MLRLSKTALAIGAALLLNGGMAMAQTTIVDSNGFEGPDYAPGNLVGQEGWLNAGSNIGTATVQSTVTNGGLQAVQVDRAANNDDYWAVPSFVFPSIGFDQIVIEWDMRVTESNNPTDFGPNFGVQAYDANGVFSQLSGLLVDSATGEVLYQAGGTGFLTPITTVNFDEWNTYKTVLNFTTSEYTVYLNGSELATTDFIDAAADEFTDAGLSAQTGAASATANAVPGTAYFDNFTVTQIPEPSSLALVAMGAALIARRRR